MLARTMMNDRLVLVTDGTAASGSNIKEFSFGGQTVYRNNGRCTSRDGTLGGSALTMAKAVANSIEQGISPNDAIRMATRNAAEVIGVDHIMGRIEKGYLANMAILDDSIMYRPVSAAGNCSPCRNRLNENPSLLI